MNSCDKFDSLIEEYLDGSLSAEENKQFTEHISSCERCREAVKMAESMHGALKSLEYSVEVPEDFLLNIHKGIKKQPERKNFITYTRRIGTVAACVVLAVVVAKGGIDHKLIKNAEELKAEETENAVIARISPQQEQEEVFTGIDTTDATEDKATSDKSDEINTQKQNTRIVQDEEKSSDKVKGELSKKIEPKATEEAKPLEKQSASEKKTTPVAEISESDKTEIESGMEKVAEHNRAVREKINEKQNQIDAGIIVKDAINEEVAAVYTAEQNLQESIEVAAQDALNEEAVAENTTVQNVQRSIEVTAKDDGEEAIATQEIQALSDVGENAEEETKTRAASGGGSSARMKETAVALLMVDFEHIEKVTDIANGYNAPENGIYTMNTEDVKALMKDLKAQGIECSISEDIQSGDISFTIIGK